MNTDKFLTDFFISSMAARDVPMEWDIALTAKCRQIAKQDFTLLPLESVKSIVDSHVASSSLSTLSCQEIEPCTVSPEIVLPVNTSTVSNTGTSSLSCSCHTATSVIAVPNSCQMGSLVSTSTLPIITSCCQIVPPSEPVNIILPQSGTESKTAQYAPTLGGRYFSSQESKLRFYFNHLLTLSGLSEEQTSSVAKYLSRMDISNLVEVAKENPVQLYSNINGTKFLTSSQAKLGVSPVVFVSD